MIERDTLLLLPENEFIRHCTVEFFKASGPGGQHRNKTSSAVRLTLNGFGLRSEDCTERSQHRNRSNAVKKLKMTLACSIRNTPAQLPERMECSMNSDDYPLFAARLLDLLQECGFDHKQCAGRCEISPSALLKKLSRDPLLWQLFCREREARSLSKLTS